MAFLPYNKMKIPELDFEVDEKWWGKPFDPADKNQLIMENISRYIAHMTEIYRSREYRDDYLWQIFYEDFEGFTTEIFTKAYCLAIWDLWTYLYNHGVWVKEVKGTSYIKVLQACLEEEEPYVWNKQEIKGRQPMPQI
jgi:hypothetical protein